MLKRAEELFLSQICINFHLHPQLKSDLQNWNKHHKQEKFKLLTFPVVSYWPMFEVMTQIVFTPCPRSPRSTAASTDMLSHPGSDPPYQVSSSVGPVAEGMAVTAYPIDQAPTYQTENEKYNHLQSYSIYIDI